jgi:4-amino-4-deoxy-L-arabinose transferase-like glycosyltransferase
MLLAEFFLHRRGLSMTDRVVRFIGNGDRSFWLIAFTTLSISLFLLSNYHCISKDGVRSVEAARNFYSGDLKAALSSVYPPGYPLLIALLYNVSHDWERAGQWVSVTSRVLLLFPLYALLHSMYSKAVARVGCFLVALSPFLAMYSVHVRTESLFVFLAALALYIFHRGMERRKTTDFFVGGLLSGFAYLVRPEALGFVVLVPGVLLLLWWTQNRWDLAWIARSILVVLAGFVLFAAPYVVYLSGATGQWGTVSRKAGVTLSVSLHEAGLLDEVADEFPTRESLSVPEFIKRHPWIYAKKVLGDIVPSIGVYFEALHYSYVPFLLLGFIAVFRERPWERKDFLLLAYFIFFMVGFAAIYVNRRYSVQLVPVSMGWTAVGVLWTWNWAKRRWNEKSARMAMAALSVVFLVTTLPKTLKPVSKAKAHLKDAGWYVRERHGAGNLTIMLSDDRIAYYAGAKALLLRDYASESDIAAQLRERNVDFLIAEPKVLKRRCPDLLQSPERYGLRFEKEFVGPTQNRLLVYRST